MIVTAPQLAELICIPLDLRDDIETSVPQGDDEAVTLTVVSYDTGEPSGDPAVSSVYFEVTVKRAD